MLLKYNKVYMTERLLANRILWIAAFALIAIGGAIYIIYRPQSILVFRISDALGLASQVNSIRNLALLFPMPNFVIYSLPAGLWTASYLMIMYCNTAALDIKTRLILSLPLPVCAIILEFMQLVGWCPGTFDVYDLICYFVPLIIFIKSINNEKTRRI